ncbi:helix-turn-helix domain-containing protein [Chryseobacterium shigense]|uniref:DNA-binding transcriptional regulator YiaG n=1 Tax=Chryseobacterium shigense TaxID=297244 RepID=A0A841NM47_9FLAO|nr:helix-turn-helix domain-containing protein [Chryseobacterium shigense]MBB6371845.1 DNA-binding transcriptional regulator YiaG [Chryseobacterium shigense]
MEKQIHKIGTPDYKKIYIDILKKKYPEKAERCTVILQKEQLTSLDVVHLNEIIFGKESAVKNQAHKSYDTEAIHEILNYQSKNSLSNSQLARHFRISRNTVAKWKKNT